MSNAAGTWQERNKFFDLDRKDNVEQHNEDSLKESRDAGMGGIGKPQPAHTDVPQDPAERTGTPGEPADPEADKQRKENEGGDDNSQPGGPSTDK